MTTRREVIDVSLARIAAFIPAGRDSKTYVRDCLDSQLQTVSPHTPLGVVPASLLSPTQLLASARFTAELLDRPGEISDRPEGIVDLTTIEWLLRPSLPLRNDLIDPPHSPPWDWLGANIVEALSKRVCRLDMVAEGHQPRQIGTGFVAGETDDRRVLIMTNTHVVDAAVGFGWGQIPGIQLACDFQRFSTVAGGALHVLSPHDPPRVHPRYDLALLVLDIDDDPESVLGEPRTLLSKSPAPTEGKRIGVIGHPSFDSTRDPFPEHFGFGNEFGIKRFSPGYIRTMKKRRWRDAEVDVFLHDATTLSGSSGSCIVDMDEKKVVGLHFGGWPTAKRKIRASGGDRLAELFESNGAVPLWKLAGDPLLTGVHFD